MRRFHLRDHRRTSVENLKTSALKIVFINDLYRISTVLFISIVYANTNCEINVLSDIYISYC